MILTENSIKSFATPEEEAEKVQVEEGTPVEPAIVEQPHSEGTASDEVYDASETITKTYATKEKIETAEAEGSASDQKVKEPLITESAGQEEESDAFVTDQSGHKKTLQNIGKVTLLESWFDAKSGSEIRKLELTIGSESKIVWHFLFPRWADYSTPKGGDRDALLELIKLSASKSGPDNPSMIHCGAGVGRTRVFIALDYLLQELESGQLLQLADPETDPVFETVNLMREQRMFMVYNEMQFKFIY